MPSVRKGRCVTLVKARAPIQLRQARPADANQITYIGTATTIISVAGFSILTDPNFLHRGDRAYLGLGITTKRLTEPALSIQQLPALDFVVLSHHHGDHFDRLAARDLDHGLPIVTEQHAARKVHARGFRSRCRPGNHRLLPAAMPRYG